MSTPTASPVGNAHQIRLIQLLIDERWCAWIDGSLRLLDKDRFWIVLPTVVKRLARVGYFPSPIWFRNVMIHGRVAGDPSAWFIFRNYVVRHPEMFDLKQLLCLEEKCWIEPLRATEDEIRQRIESNPEGHLVAELDGQVVGVIYSQRIVDERQLFHTNFRSVSALHRSNGPIVQPLAVNTLPEVQHLALGDQLLELLLQLAALQSDIESVVGVTRCKHYAQHRELPMEEYIHLRDEFGQPIDPILRFHAAHGADIRTVVNGYRPPDHENLGNGVLVEYDLRRRLDKQEIPGDLEQSRPISDLVKDAVLRVLGEERRRAFATNRPLKELGFDSFDLLKLRTILGTSLGMTISTSTFFNYNTVEALTAWFSSSRLEEKKTNNTPDSRICREISYDYDANQLEKYIAIVGLACRFPGGVANPEEFWKLLENGVDAITEVPAERWDVEALFGDDPGRIRTRFGGFIENATEFDPAFFHISPTEAKTMDPQQRLLLETHWEALESAGIAPSSLSGSQSGIFVGVFGDDYKLLQVKQGAPPSPYFGTGTSTSITAGRLAYFLGTNGPALAVDTACSSSLVAVHLACESLRKGESTLALASGVNLLLSPELSMAFSQANMLAPDGRCKTFDARADGYVRSEGCGVVVLERLGAALAAGRRIFAVIRATAINQDGASNGLTAPNGLAQQQLLQRSLQLAELEPADIDYVEAHGTGTPLGDPIEISALETVYGQGRTDDRPLWVGSVKTNMGHAEAAAGMAGLFKAVLVLQNRFLPQHLHFQSIHPHLADSKIKIPAEGQAFPTSDKPLRIGINSFGFSGTNAHVIVEEAASIPPAPREEKTTRSHYLLTVSAKNAEGLRELAERYLTALSTYDEELLPRIEFTAYHGRDHFRHRLAVVASTTKEARTLMQAFVNGQTAANVVHGEFVEGTERPRIAFLFTGQGSQYVGMARELYATHALFRERIDRCDTVLRECLGRSLLELIYPDEPPRHDDLLTSHPCGQAVNFALECALSDLWRSFGIEPHAVLGHSLGDFAAAYAAGVLSLEDGLRLVTERGRLMEKAAGSMVSVRASEAQVQGFLEGHPDVNIAAINAPASIVISGAHAGVEAVARALENAGYKVRKLDIPIAAHSAQLDPVLDAFAAAVAKVKLSPPRLSVVSSMTGKQVQNELQDPDYWRRHLRNTVRFAEGVRTLKSLECTAFIEIGPQATLISAAEQCFDDTSKLLFLPSLSDKDGHWQELLTSVGALYTRGFAPQWQESRAPLQPITLPTYPFQRQHYWFDTDTNARTNVPTEPRPDVRSLLYQVDWKIKRLPTITTPRSPGSWLILSADGALSLALRDKLTTAGETTLIARDAAEVVALLSNDVQARGIVYLPALDSSPETPSFPSLMQHIEKTLGGVLGVVQGIWKYSGERPRLFVVTQHGQCVAGDEFVAPEQSTLWGFGRVIALEHGEFWGGLIDLSPTNDVDANAELLCAELRAAHGSSEHQVAYRNGDRYVARLSRHKNKGRGASVDVLENARYLVTGGLGALGLLAADWLVEKGARHITLLGRSGIQQEKQRAAIETLQSHGALVQIVAIDVADEPAMRELFAKMALDSIPLKGILHAAGVLDDGLLINQTASRVMSSLSAKVAGGWLLHELTRHLGLDFFVMYSSAVSVMGNAGQASYAAANAFLDGLAHHRRKQGLPAMSINWGIWADAGMAQRKENVSFDGLVPMPNSLAMRAFDYIMTRIAADPNVVVMDFDATQLTYASSFMKYFNKQNLSFEHSTANGSVVEALRVMLPTSRAAHLRQVLQQTVGTVLGMRDLPYTGAGFASLGMDSLLAMKLRRQLEEALGCRLPATIGLEYPTVDILTKHLLDDVLQFDANLASAPSLSEPKEMFSSEPIAVIGMACRFPGADTPEAFWELLRAGEDKVREVPVSRWNVEAHYDPRRPIPGKTYVRAAGFIDGADQFDPLFFGIAPREVASMDPQHWLLLEVSWEALERAGVAQKTLVDSQTGVFVGIGVSHYGSLNDQRDLANLDNHAITSGAHSVAAGRLAYTLGLQGPTMAVDTACSSALVALHLACQSLRLGECDLALAGGVNLILTPLLHIALSQMQVLAPDGRCKAFDAAADGYGRGEGGAMVVLKRLRDAERDGDEVLAVIRGSALNHDGKSSGLTVPNRHAQEKLVRKALADAQVRPDEVAYVEAHGTGTPLGDPIELHALGAVFGNDRPHPLLVGTVKSNIGHLEPAAGIAGFIKTVLSLQHREIPPQIHFHAPNPNIEWDAISVEIPSAGRKWPPGYREPIAGVSSFGISGTNAHLVVAAAPQSLNFRPSSATSSPIAHVLPISAKTDAALGDLVNRYRTNLTNHSEIDLAAVCAAAALGRNHFAQRVAFVAKNHDELQQRIDAWQRGVEDAYVFRGQVATSPPTVAFLFTGQGAQYVGMGRELYRNEPVFREAIDRCDTYLRRHEDVHLTDLLYSEAANAETLSNTRYTQPALFAIEFALATLWMSLGVKPAALLGHSVGELVAACIAGVFSLEDGLRLIAARGRLMSVLPECGEMIALRAPSRYGRNLASEVAQSIAAFGLQSTVAIAAHNSPTSIVISGVGEDVRVIATNLAESGVKSQRLAVSHAFHSPLMDPMLDEFGEVAKTITYHPPQIPLISNITSVLATSGDGGVTDWRYWVRHVREAVRFAEGFLALQAQGIRICLEVGPKPVLLGMAQDCIDVESQKPLTMVPSLRENDDQQMRASLAALYVHGVEIDWDKLHRQSPRNRIPLPTYPFQRGRYWMPQRESRRTDGPGPFLDKRTHLPLHRETVYETQLDTDRYPLLTEHRVYGAIVSPGALQLAIACSIAESTFGASSTLGLADVVLPHVLLVPDDAPRTVQTVVRMKKSAPAEGNSSEAFGASNHGEFSLYSFDSALPNDVDPEPKPHATGLICAWASEGPKKRDIEAFRQRCRQGRDIAAFYARSAAGQIDLGPSFRWMVELWSNTTTSPSESLGKLVVPDVLTLRSSRVMHPGLLDACFQVATTARPNSENGEALLPFAVGSLRIFHAIEGDIFWCHAIECGHHTWNIELWDEQGSVLASIEAFAMRPAKADAIRHKNAYQDWLYRLTWLPRPTFGVHVDESSETIAPEGFAESLHTAAEALWREMNGEAYEQFVAKLEKQSVDYVSLAFAQAGLSLRPGMVWRTEQISRQLGVIPSFQRLFARLLTMLNDEGILLRDGEVWRVVKAPPNDGDAVERSAFDSAPEWILLSRCGQALGRVLRGVQEPLELLFPGGDSTVANRLYAESPRHKVMNRLVEMTISSIVKRLPTECGLRVIEIGAGTGGTTAGVLPLLPPDRTEYLFTDLGAAFLGRARERFGAYDFVQYKTIDIERLPSTQDVPHGATDLVIAANVLHATTNLHSTLAHVRALLQPGGKLVLLEATHDHRWVDLTFGLTDGWWRYADERSEHPLLTTREWIALLRQHGFSSVEVVEKGAMAVFVAQADPRYEVVGQNEQRPPWLLFAESHGLAERLFRELKRRGESAICVFPGRTYRQIDANTFELQSDCRQDYEKLFAACSDVRGAVLLMGAPGRENALDSAAKSNCAMALTLVQALLRSYREAKDFWLVTQDAQAVVEGDTVTGVAQAGLWGLGRVIALEHPELNCTRIDVSSEMAEDTLAARLCVELLGANVRSIREDQIALRECGRYVARLRRFSLPQVPEFVARPDATYAITGGFGGLGLATATWLVERGAKHLLLLGRHDPSGTVRKQLEAFSARGIHVMVARVDVCDRDELAAAFAKIDISAPLRGVFHSVGVLHDGAILHQDFKSFDEVLAPKVRGAWNLHDLTKDIPLDLFVLYSAGVGLLGNRGQANHAAANTLLDAFAHYLRRQGRNAIAIDWGAWAEIGAAAELIRQQESQLAKLGLGEIAPEHGIAALEALLAQELPPAQVGVIPIDWSRFATDQSPFFEEFATTRPRQSAQEVKAPAQAIDELLLQANPKERTDILRKHIQHAVAQTLHMKNAPPVQIGFNELGMDSLLSIEFRRRLEKELRRSLPSTIAFEYPTVETLADYLVGEYFTSSRTQENPATMQNDSLVMATGQIDVPENDAMTMALEADDDVAAKLLELEALLGD